MNNTSINNTKISKYKHIFFDLDHTLWDFETNAKATLEVMYHQFNLLEKGITDFDIFFEKYSYHNHKLWAKFSKGLIKQEELRWKRMWLTLVDFKIADKALSIQLSAGFLDLLPNQTNLFPYTFEILEYLTTRGYELHLITNGFDIIQDNKLTSSNLKPYFNQVITSESSSSIKPQKEIFMYALHKAKAQLQESIMIGDNIEADIEGGINAGMDTVFVNHLTQEKYEKANYTIFSLKELEQIL